MNTGTHGNEVAAASAKARETADERCTLSARGGQAPADGEGAKTKTSYQKWLEWSVTGLGRIMNSGSYKGDLIDSFRVAMQAMAAVSDDLSIAELHATKWQQIAGRAYEDLMSDLSSQHMSDGTNVITVATKKDRKLIMSIHDSYEMAQGYIDRAYRRYMNAQESLNTIARQLGLDMNQDDCGTMFGWSDEDLSCQTRTALKNAISMANGATKCMRDAAAFCGRARACWRTYCHDLDLEGRFGSLSKATLSL